MQATDRQALSAMIKEAIDTVAEMSPQSTDGEWLEDLTAKIAPWIREWDIAACYRWAEWPDRETYLPGTTKRDVGIDCVAVRRSDRGYIAIQCKSRQLKEGGRRNPISKPEIDAFTSTSADELWAERWVVTNGDNPFGRNAQQTIAMNSKTVKAVNIAHDLRQQQDAFTDEECPHCQPNPDGEWRRQTRSCMQDEAVAQSVRRLREHAQVNSGGLPVGQARGKIILPCGTGKTRISLRIVEELTPPGALSIVLCPSIALVAQIRREYLQHASKAIRPLAVCSDQTAGYDPKKESSRNTAADPTLDNSNVSAAEVKGKVTTDAAEIAKWIRDGQTGSQVNVILGTYQSGHRIAAALKDADASACVLIADEAHRTAGLRRKRNNPEQQQRLRDFTLCHDNDAFPATYRVYQTATPKIYNTSKVSREQPGDYIVRSMDDETVFGVELYRKSYVEAVNNDWLADYRIIALGVTGPDAHQIANQLAGATESRGRQRLTTTHFLRGMAFALAMGGAAQNQDHDSVPIKSCIAFMNTVDKSSNMANDLQSDTVTQWLQRWLSENREGQAAADYTLKHLDATSSVTARDDAKRELAEATEAKPYGIINVGIFGEGTDSPSLNAVAFLEARKSPIDVVQAVGRAMRTAPGKEMGYIICPILIPLNVDPERWLSASGPEDGWQELGQILQALRAHDQRIEDKLGELLHLYLPPEPPETETTVVALTSAEQRRITYGIHVGPPGAAVQAVNRVITGASSHSKEFSPLTESAWQPPDPASIYQRTADTAERKVREPGATGEPPATGQVPEPNLIVVGKPNGDGDAEIRYDTVARSRPAADGTPGPLHIKKSKTKARKMINEGEGIRVNPNAPRRRRSPEERREHHAMQLLMLSGLADHGNAITLNLLAKSGLTENRVVRDLNLLEASVNEAAHHLRSDRLQTALDRHFGLDNLAPDKIKSQADGCTIAALLMMNAAMLHQRIANGGWLSGIVSLATLKNDTNIVRQTNRAWRNILTHDFRPVLEPAVKVIEAVEDTGKLAGLERALHHIAAEAERIAETYADMGADHAGPLFNRVMGNQASDGAYFTRPAAASLAARLTLDVAGDAAGDAAGGAAVDWRDPQVWRDHRTVDLACGSGTLLAAMLTELKRRACAQGADAAQIAELQQLAVEDTIKGLDINPVSLQLAASQLTTGNREIRYRRMGLHLMPYGPQPGNPAQVATGTLELLGQRAIVARDGELELPDDKIASQTVWNQPHDAELEDAVAAVKDARIVIMNPPFTERVRMGEKFPKPIQEALRQRTDYLDTILVKNDPELEGSVSRRAVQMLFVTLAERCLNQDSGIFTMISPSIMLSATSAHKARLILAQRFHIHTVVTSHQPGQLNLSQNTNINESILVLSRQEGPKPPTRFINLDKMPTDEDDVADFHQCLKQCAYGPIPNGWGEVSYWPAEQMEAGNWTPAIWRSPELAQAAASYANPRTGLRPLSELEDVSVNLTSPNLIMACQSADPGTPGSFPILKSRGADGQSTITSTPDEHRILKKPNKQPPRSNDAAYPESNGILEKAGYLLITDGQRSNTSRLTAVASDTKYVGVAWMSVTGLSPQESKALAVFLNSTAGRLQIMSRASRTLEFPMYRPAAINLVHIPDVKDDRIRQTLADCWERTKDMVVPQYRDGECAVRRRWDEAVAAALGWDADELARLRSLLHQEPHVRGLGYNQYADELADE